MSPSQTDRLRAWRDRAARAWMRARGGVPRHVLYLHAQGVAAWAVDGADATPAAFDSFAAWCGAHRGERVWIHVSGTAIHSLVVDSTLRLHDAASVRRYACQQFTHYHGPQAAGWPLALWNEGNSCGACALHGVDLEALRLVATAHDVTLAALSPVWAAGLPRLAARHPGFTGAGRHGLLLVEGCAATWLVVEDGAVVMLRQRWLDAARDDAIQRLLGSLSQDAPTLSEPPIVAGWDVDVPNGLPADIAVVFGELGGPRALADWVPAAWQ